MRCPLLRKHVTSSESKQGEVMPVHDVVALEAERAVAVVKRLGLRMLTEAEWEYLARANEQRLWLSGARDPAEFVEDFCGQDLFAGEEPFGVHGLPWGTWVDDGWAPSYKGAPADGSARQPYELPQVVRGGGAPRSFPWQVDGEALLLLTIHRDRAEKGMFPVLAARDLPARRG